MRKYFILFSCLFITSGVCPLVQAQDITSIAGNGTYGYSGDGGPATVAQLEYIWRVAMDNAGNRYFTDNANHRIRKVTPGGTISTYAGTGIAGTTGDGGQATAAQISGPSGIVADGAGNIYFADASAHRIRMISTTGVISTIAGTGIAGFGGDGGLATAALLNSPYDLKMDFTGNLYIADVSNHRVRMINTSGMISTIAGTGMVGFSGDGGPATDATFSSPASIAVDFEGNVYVGDLNNNRIRKVNTAGMITTIAGTGASGFGGDGGAATVAQISQPLGVAVDAIGNVFISDQYNHRIRKVNDSGIISTMAGTGIPGFSGDGGPATEAEIRQPFGIYVDTFGDLLLCDWGNYRLRAIHYHNHLPAFTSGESDSIVLCENDFATPFNSRVRVTDTDTGQILKWTLISGPQHGSVNLPYTTASTGGTVTPTGLNYTPVSGYYGMDTFKVRVDDGHSIDTLYIYARVKPLPTIAPITGSPLVCIGAPITLTTAVPGGIWSRSNANATVSSTGVVDGIYYGVDTIWYTITIEGCSSSVSKVLSIYPIVDSIAGVPAVCKGLSVLWTGIPAGGTWTASNNVVAFVSGGIINGLSPGKDTITYTVTNPCGTSTFTKVITVNDPIAPVVFITGNPGAFILPGQSDTLKANITGATGIAFDYQWQKNGTDIPGATDSTYISSTFNHADSMTCIVTNGPCSASSFAWMYIVWVGVGLADMQLSHGDLVVMPNPNQGSFNIGGLNPQPEPISLMITDMTGRVVYTSMSEVENGRLKQPIALNGQLANGMYLLQVSNGQEKKIVRFVISQ